VDPHHLFNVVSFYIEHLGRAGYILLFILSLVESLAIIGTFVPGTIFIILAGFAASQGFFDIWLLIVAAVLGAIVGDTLSYFLGKRGINYFKDENKYLKRTYLAKGEKFFLDYGDKSVFFARFIGLLRPIVPFVAGLSCMNFARFMTWNVLGAVAWGTSHLAIGYFFGDATRTLERWSYGLGTGVFVIIATIVVYFVFIKKRFRESL
jgi:undecaprenyl-diphosphatase